MENFYSLKKEYDPHTVSEEDAIIESRLNVLLIAEKL